MFAGKSSYILSQIRRYKSIGWTVLCLTSALDTRYENDAIHSHNHERHSAIATNNLISLISTPAYKEARLIVIEEGQFFPDLYDFTLQAVDCDKKDVLVVGLDGDAQRRPFGELLTLIPICDKVTKLTAICKACAATGPQPAIFTHRKISDELIIRIGTADEYESLCRTHYLIRNQ
jgi:thymidine kinase